MKTYLLTIAIFLSGLTSVSAQSNYVAFPDSNAHWYTNAYITPMGNYIGYDYHYYLRDSTVIINNKTYSCLFFENYWSPGEGIYGYLRTDSMKRTYYHTRDLNDSVERLTLDFSLNEGDTITYEFSATNIGRYRIDSIGDILILDSPRKKFHLSRIGDIGQGEIWVEGIGSLSGPSFPFY